MAESTGEAERRPEGRRVAVIGAGILGASASLFLSQHGFSVTCVEREGVSSGSTAYAAGILSRQLWDPVAAGLVTRTLEICAAELPPERRPRPALSVTIAPHGARSGLSRIASVARESGAGPELVSAADAARRLSAVGLECRVSPDEAALVTRDAYAISTDVTTGLGRNAHEAGTRLRIALARRLVVKKGRVIALETASGTVEADEYVLAAGAWSKALAAASGLPLPLKPYRTQLAALATDGRFPEAVVHDAAKGYYLRPEGDGFLAGDGTEERECDPDSFNRRADPEFVPFLAERLADRFPGLASARLRHAWAGVCTATPDRRPLLGRHPDVENLWLATGCNGFGFMRGPAMGEALAKAIEEGKDPIPEYSPARWNGKFPEDFEVRQGFTVD